MPLHIITLLLALSDRRQRIVLGNHATVHHNRNKVEERDKYGANDVRPGLTGLAQCSGRNAISWEKRFELDVWYVDHISFETDMKVILTTVKKVFISEGISSGTSVTMEEFKGTGEKHAE